MGNSNVKLMDIVDEVAVMGDLTPVLKSTGGYAAQPALSIANTVMGEMLSVRMPWKWNRVKIAPFLLTPLQQDYASINIQNIGWVENGVRIDINNTQVPPPSWKITAVRDIEIDHSVGGFPNELCWFPNNQMEYETWPGAGVTYTNPVGPSIINENKWTNIYDQAGNILVLTKYGTTGLLAPVAPLGAAPGVVVIDGTCEWTVADPLAQGFRFLPRPPTGGNVWLVRIFAQMKQPPRFINLGQFIDPIPDEYSKWFIDGFIAYAHRYSADPAVKARYREMKTEWLDSIAQAARQGDREDEAKGFFPDRSIASPSFIQDQGPYPYRWGGWR
jgi:hypothetical protein